MYKALIKAPIHKKDNIVKFIGGKGKIKSYYIESNRWIYIIEMEMGSEPDFGRIGCETMILLEEVDII